MTHSLGSNRRRLWGGTPQPPPIASTTFYGIPRLDRIVTSSYLISSVLTSPRTVWHSNNRSTKLLNTMWPFRGSLPSLQAKGGQGEDCETSWTTHEAHNPPLWRSIPQKGLVDTGGGVGHQWRPPCLASMRAELPSRPLITWLKSDHDQHPPQCQYSRGLAPMSPLPVTKPYLDRSSCKLICRAFWYISTLLSLQNF